jgi:hypothetical protein
MKPIDVEINFLQTFQVLGKSVSGSCDFSVIYFEKNLVYLDMI